MAQNEKKEFVFINEQIKKKPVYRRRWFIRTVTGMLLSIAFGAAAGVAYSVVRPWAEVQFGQPEEPTQIVVVQKETESESRRENIGETESDAEEQSINEPESGSETMAESETVDGGNTDVSALDIQDYKNVYEQMRTIASEAAACIVKVNVYTTDTDWFNGVYENISETSGLILRMDRNLIYVLTYEKAVQNASQISVTFPNGERADASVRKMDDVTEMAVLEISRDSIERSTRKSIETVTMKGVSTVEKGEPVIAVGSPLGYADSLAYGMITSVTMGESMDSEYGVISTDISGSDQSYGILLNLDGDIVGVISQKFEQNPGQDTVSALRISDLSELLDTLIADAPISFIGIVGREVDTDAAQRFAMPYGIYIKEVEPDSPAMYVGVQTADILTAVDGESIRTVRDYIERLRDCRQGEVLRLSLRRKSMDGYVEVEVEVTVGTR